MMEAVAEQINVRKYEAYKDSGVEWLGKIPEHWEVVRLKNCCQMIVSNVDKHIKPNERPVELCNYVDVYKNEFITATLNFMEATASEAEIQRYKLQRDDVLITKDSEDWKDIGVPALVKHAHEKLLCGYHLAILRPYQVVIGGYLMRALTSQYVRCQFSVKANGITRYGISHGGITSTSIAVPPLSEQTAIADFLDRKTAQIDKAIALKEALIERLKERRQILIHRAVTRGLNPDARMTDSGVEWIGEVPEHWEVKRLKFILTERNERSGDGSEPLLMMSQAHGLVVRSEYHEKAEVAKTAEGNKIVHKGDLVFNKLKAHLGVFFRSNLDFEGIVSPDYAVYFSNSFVPNVKLLELLFKQPGYIKQFICRATGIVEGLIRLYTSDLFDIAIPVPSQVEQGEILQFATDIENKTNEAIGRAQMQIEKLREYKSTLINSAVTGKIKVS